MKRPRTSTVLGTLTGLTLIAIAMAVLPACSTLPPYIAVGFHWTTTPPPPPTPTSTTVLHVATPTAAAAGPMP